MGRWFLLNFEKYFFVLLSFFSFLVFYPAFVTEFGVHNDYVMLEEYGLHFLKYMESGQMILIGRALNAVWANLQTGFTHQIADFSLWRVFSFCFLIANTFLLYKFLIHKFKLEVFWAGSIAFGILFLPANQVFILWSNAFLIGTFNVFLVFVSYFLLDSIKTNNVLKVADTQLGLYFLKLGGSGIFFIASLFTYPSTSMFVFVLTGAHVLFSPILSWKKTRRIIIRDVLFFGILMVVYRILDRGIIYPLALESGWFPVLDLKPYQMGIGIDIVSKISLLKEIIVLSLSGVGHSISVYGGVVFVLGAILICLVVLWMQREKIQNCSKNLAIQIVLFLMGLFFLANAPMLIAKGSKIVFGYRVLLPGSALILMVLFSLLRLISRLCQRMLNQKVFKFLAVVIVVFSGGIAWRNTRLVSKNCNQELNIIRSVVAQGIKDNVDGIIIKFIKNRETLVGQRLPFELGFMLTEYRQVRPILTELFKKLNKEMIPFFVLQHNVNIVKSKGVAVVDFNTYRKVSPPLSETNVNLVIDSLRIYSIDN